MNYIEYIEKPWGYEKIIEKNKNYVLKELFMKEGFQCSLQYHKEKKETIYLLKGTMKLIIGDKKKLDENIIGSAGFNITIDPFTIHRMTAVTDILYLEASTPELQDVVRLEDDYGR